MLPDELRAEVAKINWWHSIDLGHGIVTPGRTNLPDKVGYIGLPDDLTGRSVLDVGAWDGLLSAGDHYQPCGWTSTLPFCIVTV